MGRLLFHPHLAQPSAGEGLNESEEPGARVLPSEMNVIQPPVGLPQVGLYAPHPFLLAVFFLHMVTVSFGRPPSGQVSPAAVQPQWAQQPPSDFGPPPYEPPTQPGFGVPPMRADGSGPYVPPGEWRWVRAKAGKGASGVGLNVGLWF